MNLDDKRFLEAIGHRIRERRMAMELTQAELADRCELHRTFIGSVERGERNLAMLSLRRIARALRVKPVELVSSDDRPTVYAKNRRSTSH
jgi:transcriptional regulator with XRE-family HTH domain